MRRSVVRAEGALDCRTRCRMRAAGATTIGMAGAPHAQAQLVVLEVEEEPRVEEADAAHQPHVQQHRRAGDELGAQVAGRLGRRARGVGVPRAAEEVADRRRRVAGLVVQRRRDDRRLGVAPRGVAQRPQRAGFEPRVGVVQQRVVGRHRVEPEVVGAAEAEVAAGLDQGRVRQQLAHQRDGGVGAVVVDHHHRRAVRQRRQRPAQDARAVVGDEHRRDVRRHAGAIGHCLGTRPSR